jgi:hypothetical protein
MPALQRITARRTWLVHDFSVWGTPTLGELEFLISEFPIASGEIYYGTADIGDSAQTIEFGQLTDHRGNSLPSTISSPHVIVRSHSQTPVFLVGRESDSSFKIAHDPSTSGPVTVDLLITEMGE